MGSVVNRLLTYLRASMGQTRLIALALLNVNYDANIDIFARKREREKEL